MSIATNQVKNEHDANILWYDSFNAMSRDSSMNHKISTIKFFGFQGVAADLTDTLTSYKELYFCVWTRYKICKLWSNWRLVCHRFVRSWVATKDRTYRLTRRVIAKKVSHLKYRHRKAKQSRLLNCVVFMTNVAAAHPIQGKLINSHKNFFNIGGSLVLVLQAMFTRTSETLLSVLHDFFISVGASKQYFFKQAFR